jgi:hypothetical protein
MFWRACLIAAVAAFAFKAHAQGAARVKDRQAAAMEREAEARNTLGAYTIPQIRPKTARDSGREGMMLFIRNANFRFVRGVGFFGEDLAVAVNANDGVSPVIFDDPQAVNLRVLSGSLIVSAQALTDLLNTHVFNFAGAPVRNLRAATAANALTLSGEMNRRGKWAPFSMTGPVTMEGGSRIAFAPSEIAIDGRSATELLKAANVSLDELIRLEAPGVKLEGNVIRMDAAALFPPPRMAFELAAATVDARGLRLTMTAPIAPAWPKPPLARDSYALIQGGDVKFLTVMTVNTLMQIVAADGGALDFSLYDYRPQLAGGSFQFRMDGGLIVSLARSADPEAMR